MILFSLAGKPLGTDSLRRLLKWMEIHQAANTWKKKLN
jgi:hypothetical protein